MPEPHSCVRCAEWVHPKRWALGYRVCRECGEAQAVADRKTWTIVPLHKGHYTRVTDIQELKQLNQKPR
jgi:hypothetical protein